MCAVLWHKLPRPKTPNVTPSEPHVGRRMHVFFFLGGGGCVNVHPPLLTPPAVPCMCMSDRCALLRHINLPRPKTKLHTSSESRKWACLPTCHGSRVICCCNGMHVGFFRCGTRCVAHVLIRTTPRSWNSTRLFTYGLKKQTVFPQAAPPRNYTPFSPAKAQAVAICNIPCSRGRTAGQQRWP